MTVPILAGRRLRAVLVVLLLAPLLASMGATKGGTSAAASTDRARPVATKQAAATDPVELHASFVSATGWVKPGDAYPFRVFVRNREATPVVGVRVTVEAPPSTAFTDVTALNGAGSATTTGSSITWEIPSVAGAVEGTPTVATLVVEARAFTLTQDPEVVWKDLSATATMRYTGLATPVSSSTHGPKVIPPTGGFETARYGDKPFPVVPVEYVDRKHQADNTAEALDRAINDPTFVGSTFNLYQEMSYGQLFPHGTVPSAGIQTADFESYAPGFEFTTRDQTRGCRGVTFGDLGAPPPTPRIVDGWYQLPGNTEYYGGDYPAFTVGVAGSIDSACGQLGKGVYDAAQVADPEIDYNDYDFDKDGVVDFFMLVFVGCGGNGASQLSVAGCPYPDAPYDNIWPHSASLEQQYKDEETGLRGYISDDQLKSLDEVPQCWLDDTYVTYTDCRADGGLGDDDLPVLVRVGPYNVNPETAIDSASVISHEFGHHLGLPDFYNQAEGEYYADLNLMAADYSQHMTVFAKQELGWVVPDFLQPGESVEEGDWPEIKTDTEAIHWVRPDGTPYTLSAANGDQNIHNGRAYALKLPTRQLIDPEQVAEQASGSHVWYSGRGNDFGCSPTGGHNLDVFLPELTSLAEGTEVEVTFKSSWDIEWDWDYGFVLTSGDGRTYTSHPSENGYTTSKAYNPNNQGCLNELDNGITGQSGAYEDGEPAVTIARNPAGPDYGTGAPFLEDRYDISDLVGTDSPVLRFSYFTDAAFDRPGWFIDDVVVTAGDEVIYESDFEDDEEEGRLFPGGCDPDGVRVAIVCTAGWRYLAADADAPLDHGYYLELRDQAGFDFDGHGQSERGDTSWDPGVFIEYTDEAHGYGNNGVPPPPAQHYLDSQPIPGSDCVEESGPEGNCTDASFTAAEGDSHFDDEDWVDNFSDPSREDGQWRFDHSCLSLDVRSMSGDTDNSAALPADLTAAATIAAGEGCRLYGFGFDPGPLGDDGACLREKVPPVAFDDIRTNLHQDNIACVAWYSIALGRGDVDGDGRPEYDPNGSVTRGQMASFIARLAAEAGVELPAAPPNAFADDDRSTHSSSVDALAALGIVRGVTADRYEPSAPVTREQMATFLARVHESATGTAPTGTRDAFGDDDGRSHEANTNAMAALGVIRGRGDLDGDGKEDFVPTAAVSRAQMASFIARQLGVFVGREVAHQGGASIALDATRVAPGQVLPGTVASNKDVRSVTVTGCGAPPGAVTVGPTGAFSVRVGNSQPRGACGLTFEVVTDRSGARQSVRHVFSLLVE